MPSDVPSQGMDFGSSGSIAGRVLGRMFLGGYSSACLGRGIVWASIPAKRLGRGCWWTSWLGLSGL